MNFNLYKFSIGEHYSKKVIWITFPKDYTLIKELRERFSSVKWSSTHKAWYLPDLPSIRTALQINPTEIGDELIASIASNNQEAFLRFRNQLKLKAYSKNTIRTYTTEFAHLLRTIKHYSVNELTQERLKDYFLYCIKKENIKENHLNSRINAIKFYFEKVLHREKMFFDIPRPKTPKQLPKMLAKSEIKKIFKQTSNPKHLLMLQLSYGMGLRVSEIVNLKIEHINSEDMLVLIAGAKGKKDNKDNIGAIFTTYRLLASDEERPLPVTLDSTYINQLHSELETDGRNIKESGYYDLVAMQLAHGHSVSLIEGGDIKYVAELMDYYVDHGDLLVNSVGWNIPLLNETLQYMVNHKLGYKLLLSDILPQFEDIKNRIGVTDEVFIEHLAEWNTDLDKYITKNNIKDVIPDASFYDLTTKISNVLTDHINKIAFEALSEISVDTLYAQRTAHTSYYWFVAIKHLLAKIKSLPDNLTEFGKKILMDIASGTQSLNPFPNCFKNIVERLDKRKIKSTVTDIRNDFCIGKKTINAIKFQFFETWLRSHGNLKSQAGDVIDKIVKPVISDGACRSLILQNKDFYMDLINTAGDDAYELKKSLRNLIQKDSDPQLVKFVNSIDSVPEVETA